MMNYTFFAGYPALLKKAQTSTNFKQSLQKQTSYKQSLPESNYFLKIGKTNKSTGNQIMNKFSYNSNAIRGKMRL